MLYKKITLIGAIIIFAGTMTALAVSTRGNQSNNVSSQNSPAFSQARMNKASNFSATKISEKGFQSSISRYKDLLKKNKSFVIDMVDAKNGWLINKTGVYVTSNNAHSWTNKSTSFWDSDMFDLQSSFVDKDSAFISFMDKSNNLLLYSTQNGGKCWNKYNLSKDKTTGDISGNITSESSLVYMHYFDKKTGMIYIGSDAAAGKQLLSEYFTIDGGRTWREIASKIYLSDGYMNFRFIDSSNGLLFTNDSGYGYTIQVTGNSGKSWSDPPVVLNSNYGVNLLSPIFIQSSTRIALFSCRNGTDPLGTDSNTTMQHRKNSLYNNFVMLNANGSIVGKIASLTTDLPLSDKTVSFISGNQGFCIAHVSGISRLYGYLNSSGTFYEVTKKSWMDNVIQLQFINSTQGYAFCPNIVYVTNDGGKSWSPSSI